jgi:hypothetical protein
MCAEQILGGFVLFAVFLGFVYYTGIDLGWKELLKNWTGVIVFFGAIALGVFLINTGCPA